MMGYERQGDDQIRAAFALGGEAAWYQPPDPGPECLWCDGTKMVTVGSIISVDNQTQRLADFGHDVDVECPRCREHPGVEPVAPREDR